MSRTRGSSIYKYVALAAGLVILGGVAGRWQFQLPEVRSVSPVEEKWVLPELPDLQTVKQAMSQLHGRFSRRVGLVSGRTASKKNKSDWHLRGQVFEGEMAFVLVEQNGTLQRLKVGDQLANGDRILEISHKGIVVESLGESVELDLHPLN